MNFGFYDTSWLGSTWRSDRSTTALLWYSCRVDAMSLSLKHQMVLFKLASEYHTDSYTKWVYHINGRDTKACWHEEGRKTNRTTRTKFHLPLLSEVVLNYKKLKVKCYTTLSNRRTPSNYAKLTLHLNAAVVAHQSAPSAFPWPWKRRRLFLTGDSALG